MDQYQVHVPSWDSRHIWLHDLAVTAGNHGLTTAVSSIEDFLTDEKSHFISANCQMQFFKFLFFIIGKWESASSIHGRAIHVWEGTQCNIANVKCPVLQDWCINISPCLPNRGVPSRDVNRKNLFSWNIVSWNRSKDFKIGNYDEWFFQTQHEKVRFRFHSLNF